MDKECISLCKAINSISGLQTTESCCGHGDTPFRVWFTTEDLDALPDLLYWLNYCHSGCSGWQVTVTTDCVKSPVSFCIEGPVGAYKEAEKIASLIYHD